jgi:hypothetical protein
VAPSPVPRADHQLVLAAAHLQSANGEAWAKFLEAYRAYHDKVVRSVVQAPPEALHIAQGRAQSLGMTLELLENCRKHADELAAHRRDYAKT